MKFWRLWKTAEAVKDETEEVLLEAAECTDKKAPASSKSAAMPVVDAKVAEHDKKEADKNSGSSAVDQQQTNLSKPDETVSYVIHKHPFFFVLKMLKQWLVLLPFILLLLYVVPVYASPTEQLLLNVIVVFLLVSSGIVAFIHWHMNVSLVFPETLQTFYFHNILRQHHEGIELERLNTFDLEKKGLLPYLLNYADLNLSTVVKESGAEDKLTIQRVWKPEEALKVIKYYSDGNDTF